VRIKSNTEHDDLEHLDAGRRKTAERQYAKYQTHGEVKCLAKGTATRPKYDQSPVQRKPLDGCIYGGYVIRVERSSSSSSSSHKKPRYFYDDDDVCARRKKIESPPPPYRDYVVVFFGVVYRTYVQ
jgi:hypothetical protein